MQRRSFLKFITASSALGVVSRSEAIQLFSYSKKQLSALNYSGISFSSIDSIVLCPELKYDILIKWEDKLNAIDHFGFNNDYLNFVSMDGKKNEGILWVNHEYIDRLMFRKDIQNPTVLEIQKEMYSVGGSLVHIQKNAATQKWEVVFNSPLNKRISALTKIPFTNNQSVLGKDFAMGTLGNCAGGKTPWNTILTCEENYDLFYGETIYKNGMSEHEKSLFQWEDFYNNPPEHYGWVVEINPITGEAKKHISMGRFAHESATTILAESSNKVVVYTGDDAANEHLYKFISDTDNSLDTGKLYVANLEKGEWLLLERDSHPELKAQFKNQMDLLIHARKAAKILGATPLDRPEDIEIHPLSKEVFVSLTNNTKKGNYHGAILKIKEENNNPCSLKFSHEYFLTGGEESGFSCPDNLVFDNRNNLWFTSDISGTSMNKKEYLPFKNNGLFMVPISGKNAGKVIQIASAPNNAEFTGPYFSPDFETLFLSVQHPGEYADSFETINSHWPNGGNEIPRPAVIAISVV